MATNSRPKPTCCVASVHSHISRRSLMPLWKNVDESSYITETVVFDVELWTRFITLTEKRATSSQWPSSLQCLTVVGSSHEPPPVLADMSAGTWIEKAWLPCWPLYSQQVLHQRWISGIHCTQATKHASEGLTVALKPRGDIIRSPKQGYQWPRQNLKKKKKVLIFFPSWLFLAYFTLLLTRRWVHVSWVFTYSKCEGNS